MEWFTCGLGLALTATSICPNDCHSRMLFLSFSQNSRFRQERSDFIPEQAPINDKVVVPSFVCDKFSVSRCLKKFLAVSIRNDLVLSAVNEQNRIVV